MKDSRKPVELPPLGLYRHYKTGALHEVMDYSILQPTRETLVLYRPAGMPHTKWACLIGYFVAMVEKDGERVPRFTLVSKD